MNIDSTTLQTLFTQARNTGAATLRLPAGTYPPSGIKKISFANPLLVTAEPGAVFLGIVGQFCDGPVTVRGLTVKVDPGQGVGIRGGFAGWTFDGCEIFGSAVGADGHGFLMQNCNGLTLTNNHVHHCVGGFNILHSDNVKVDGNRTHDVQVDGMQFVGGSHITVTGNQFTDIYPKPGDHSDAIQFVTVGATAPLTDIIIKGNTYVRGKSPSGTQGIFMGNEGGFGYQGVTVSDNSLLGTIYQGIFLNHIQDVECRNNVVASFADAPTVGPAWIKADVCTGNLSDNIATGYLLDTSPALVQGNNLKIAPIAPTDHYSPPVVAPPPPDPIVVLKGQLAAANADLAAMTARAVTSEASLADALKRLADVGAALSADEAKLAAVRADVGP